MQKKYNPKIYKNYVNTADKLLGEIDQIRAENQVEIKNLTFEQETIYRRDRIVQGLRGTGFVYEIKQGNGIGFIRDSSNKYKAKK